MFVAMFKLNDRRFNSRIFRVVFVLVILFMGFILWLNLLQIKKLNQSYAINQVHILSNKLRQNDIFLEAMRGQAKERLRSKYNSFLTNQLYHRLQVLPDNLLVLDDIPLELPSGLVGNLTGAGPLPEPGSWRESMLHLALSISPLLSTASEHLDENISWVYFTGVDNFMYLYPWVPSQQFHFTKSIYEGPYFWQLTLSAADSITTKATIYTPSYSDAAGQGDMFTMSKLLSKDEQLVGMFSIDIKLQSLQQWLDESHNSYTLNEYVLLNQQNQILASSVHIAQIPVEFPATTDSYQWHNGALQLTLAVPNTPLRLVYSIPLRVLTQSLLYHSFPALAAAMFMLLAILYYMRSLRINRRLEYLFCHDALTRAFNRHYLVQLKSSKALERLCPDILLFDVDHFKRVNDNFGHDIGDQVLIKLVQLCQQCLPASDNLIRWGGEEFLVLASARAEGELGAQAERLRCAIADYDWTSVAIGLKVTISVGYHPYTANISFDEAVSRADMALYQAKAKGRNRSEASPNV